jgi:hypothetical protein
VKKSNQRYKEIYICRADNLNRRIIAEKYAGIIISEEIIEKVKLLINEMNLGILPKKNYSIGVDKHIIVPR